MIVCFGMMFVRGFVSVDLWTAWEGRPTDWLTSYALGADFNGTGATQEGGTDVDIDVPGHAPFAAV